MISANDPWTSAVLDAVPHPMLVIDSYGNVAQVNRAATDILGYPDRRELLGRPSHEALHSRRQDGTPYPAHECPIVRTPAERGRSPRREIFLDRSGSPLPVTWTVSALPHPRFKLLAFSARGTSPLSVGSPSRSLPTADNLRGQVREEFRDPRLTPLRLAETNRASLRTLQAILAREGSSPASLIRSERLRYARGLLGRGMPLRIVAFESGFSDADTFSRAFRRHFGASPGSYVTRSA